jgi:hypothetical protein
MLGPGVVSAALRQFGIGFGLAAWLGPEHEVTGTPHRALP